MASEQTMHTQAISLVGKYIESASRKGSLISGKVINAMFDSMLVESKEGKKILVFDDLLFLREVPDTK